MSDPASPDLRDEKSPADVNVRSSDATMAQDSPADLESGAQLPRDSKHTDDTVSENDSQPGTTSGTVVAPGVSKEEPQPAETDKEDEGPLIIDWEGPDDPENPRKCVQPRAPGIVHLYIIR